ncbi:MAG: Gfo/Idh/MocA family oxidoreductase, partial [Bacteroidota bacterium]
MTPICTALLAYGMSGQVFHAPFLDLHPGYDLHWVWQRTRSDAQDRYPQLKIARQLEEILNDSKVELVIVNTPEPTHMEFASKALEAGKHVVVEKAFTPSVSEANALIELARTKQRQLTVYHNRRWDSDFLTISELLRQDLLGQILEYEATYYRFRPEPQATSWKEQQAPGISILYNLGSHLIDQALQLFGRPDWVFADLRKQRKASAVFDQFDLMLLYPDKKALLRAGYLVAQAHPRYRIRGKFGSLVKHGLDPQEAQLKAGKSPGVEKWGEEPEEDWGHLYYQKDGLSFKGKLSSLPGNYGA